MPNTNISTRFMPLLPIFLLCLLLPLLFFPSWDHQLFIWLNQKASSLPSFIWANVNILGEGLFIIGVLSIVGIRHPRFSVIALFGGLGLGILVHVSKVVIAAPRPFATFDEDILSAINTIGAPLRIHSFPSGHSAAALFLAAAVITYFGIKNKWLFFLILSIGLLVAFARIAIAGHFPSDVLCGSLLGWLAGWLGMLWLKNKPLPDFAVLVSGLLFMLNAIFLWFHGYRNFLYPNAVVYTSTVMFFACSMYIVFKHLFIKFKKTER